MYEFLSSLSNTRVRTLNHLVLFFTNRNRCNRIGEKNHLFVLTFPCPGTKFDEISIKKTHALCHLCNLNRYLLCSLSVRSLSRLRTMLLPTC